MMITRTIFSGFKMINVMKVESIPKIRVREIVYENKVASLSVSINNKQMEKATVRSELL